MTVQVHETSAVQEKSSPVTAPDSEQPTGSSANGRVPHAPAVEDDAEETGALPLELDAPEGDSPPAVPLLTGLESLLFVADEPVALERLAQALRCSAAEIEAGVAHLRDEYERHNRGVRLQERAGLVQLVTNPAAAQAVEDFLSLDLTTRLSGPALETLAIVAYRQPVTRVQIEAVRGVDCSGMVRKLEQHGLVEEVGRLETPGRPILYGVTDLFLQHFGLTSLDQLPTLPELDAEALQNALAASAEID